MLVERTANEIRVTQKNSKALNAEGFRLPFTPGKFKSTYVIYDVNGKKILAEHSANDWVRAENSGWLEKETGQEDENGNKIVDRIPDKVHSKVEVLGEIEEMAGNVGDDHLVSRPSARQLEEIKLALQEYGIHRSRVH